MAALSANGLTDLIYYLDDDDELKKKRFFSEINGELPKTLYLDLTGFLAVTAVSFSNIMSPDTDQRDKSSQTLTQPVRIVMGKKPSL